MAAPRAFGAPLERVSEADFVTAAVTLQIGVAPNRIDVSTRIDGVTFEVAWPNRTETVFGDQPIWLIGRTELAANKKAAGRPQDLLDLAMLERHDPH
jgi:hypothetical protein